MVEQKAQATGLAIDENWIGQNIHPNALGELRDSKTGLYKLAGDYHRPIGRKLGGTESLHAEAMARYEQDASYRPEKLAEYLRSKK